MRDLETFFKDGCGKFSMMRLLCFIVTVLGMIGIVLHPEQSTELCVLVGAAIAGKWVQQRDEK
jgi:hypothetical protein